MISSLFFLILVLLIASVDALTTGIVDTATLPSQVLQIIVLYGFTLLAIVFQNALGKHRYISRSRLLLIANIELVTLLAFFQFHLQFGALLRAIPALEDLSTLTAIAFLSLYFFGLILFYMTTAPSRTRPITYMKQQLRLITPFALPFLFFCVFSDIASVLAPTGLFQIDGLAGQIVILTVFSAIFVTFLMLVLPPLIVRIWGCQPMPDNALKERLLALCTRTSFNHGGILVWTEMHGYLTAAIVGVFPRFRYVMFTQGLLDELPAAEVEAILAHEIGHSRHRHLITYPLIIFGAVAILALFEKWAVPVIMETLGPRGEFTSLALFIPEAMILLLYLRIVFGYFSRLFERQADLHVFEIGIDPHHMIHALDHLAAHSGHIHDQPSWHHWSIRQRMDFLSSAVQNPTIVTQHHQRVLRSIVGYLVIVTLAFALLLL